jgi:hypothetical protein
MELTIIINNDCLYLYEELKNQIDPNKVTLKCYNEDVYKERQKAFKVKGGYGARQTPFAVATLEGPLKAFYSEDGSCTVENIINYLK